MIAGAPARTEVGARIYSEAINAVMVSKFTQGDEKLDEAIKSARTSSKQPCASDREAAPGR